MSLGSGIAEIKEDLLNLASKSSNTGESDYFGGNWAERANGYSSLRL